MAASRERRLGIALVAVATVLWSLAGYFVRLIDLDVWQILGWRAFFGALALFAIMLFQHGRHVGSAFAALTPISLVAIPLSAVSMYGYVAALTLTDVANVMVMYATIPFVAAGIAFFWLGERPGRRVVVASAVSFVGVAVMAVFAAGASDMRGNALAFLMTAGFAFVLVLARRSPNLPMAPINGLAAALCFAAAWPLMPETMPTPEQFVLLAVLGITTNALAYLLFMAGGRFIPSGEAGLIALLDVVLGPLWVFLAFNEIPSGAALFAGAVVLGATAWYLIGLRREEPGVAAAAPDARP